MNQQEFEDTLQHFSFFLSSRGRKPSTIKRYVYDIEDFGRWLQASNRFQEDSIWGNLKKEDFEAYFQELQYTRKYGEKTIHRITVVLKKLYQFLDIPSPIVESRELRYQIGPTPGGLCYEGRREKAEKHYFFA